MQNYNKWLSFNHNKGAIMFAIFTITMLVFLVKNIPEIGIAPIETWARSTEKLAIFTVGWAIGLRLLGGWAYSVTEKAKTTQYGMIAIACAIIIGSAIVIAAKS